MVRSPWILDHVRPIPSRSSWATVAIGDLLRYPASGIDRPSGATAPMNAKDMIRSSLQMSDRVINSYIGDLEDGDLLIRAVPGMNHIAWQLGHLIASERHFVELVRPGSCPPLPDDFEAGHGRKATQEDDPSKYYSRARYQELWKTQREATNRVLDEVPETELDRTNPGVFPDFAPTVGALLNMCGAHAVMHCGQFVAVRRKLNKPVLI
jgi:hypothetical protein